MAVYKCNVCGYIYDEEKEKRPFSELKECPVCRQGPENFIRIPEDDSDADTGAEAGIPEEADADDASPDLRYDAAYARRDASCRCGYGNTDADAGLG